MIKTDYLVIGSGIAGLSFALKACKTNDVALLTKKKLFDSSTGKAQGGVACVTDKDDTFESHIQDTLVAGDGLCNKEIVEIAVKSAPERIQELISMGMKFAKRRPAAFCGFYSRNREKIRRRATDSLFSYSSAYR